MRAQRGYVLAELAVAAAVACMLAIWTASLTAGRIEDAQAEATGRWLLGLRAALEQMLAGEYEVLAGAQADSGRYADPYAPTLGELKAAGHLAEGFPERAPLGLSVQLRVLRAGGCPGQECRLEAVAVMPTVLPGEPGPDPVRIGQILLATGGYGGSVRAARPDRLRGVLFDLPNPLTPAAPVLPPGSVAVYGSLDLTLFDRFVRMRDTRDPRLRGAFTVDGQVQAGGDILASAGVRAEGPLVTAAGVSAGGDVQVQGGLSVAGTVTAGGLLRARGDIRGDGAVNAAGRISSGEFLQLRSAVPEGGACAGAGLVARSASGAVLSCQGGRWQGATGTAWLSEVYMLDAGTDPLVQVRTLPAGARMCAVAQHFFTSSELLHRGYNFAHRCAVGRNAAGRWQLTLMADTGRTQCQAVCLQ